MKKALRFAALLGILGLTVWSADERPAWATVTCEGTHGTPCSPRGAAIPCTYPDGGPGSCHCAALPPSAGSYWICSL